LQAIQDFSPTNNRRETALHDAENLRFQAIGLQM
jgi:hypothetical protein